MLRLDTGDERQRGEIVQGGRVPARSAAFDSTDLFKKSAKVSVDFKHATIPQWIRRRAASSRFPL